MQFVLFNVLSSFFTELFFFLFKFLSRWVWMPGFEKWSTGRCRTRHLTHLKMPSYRSTRWCTGTPTHDSSPPTSTSRSFTAARVPPPNPSPSLPPPPLLILHLQDWCQTISPLLSHSSSQYKTYQKLRFLLSSLLWIPDLSNYGQDFLVFSPTYPKFLVLFSVLSSFLFSSLLSSWLLLLSLFSLNLSFRSFSL